MGFIAELKRRHVFRVGIAYLVLAWAVIQVLGTVEPALKLIGLGGNYPINVNVIF